MINLTFVLTWPGVTYIFFIIDAHFRKFVGSHVAAYMEKPVLDAIEMARWYRGNNFLDYVATRMWTVNSRQFVRGSALRKSLLFPPSGPTGTVLAKPRLKDSSGFTRMNSSWTPINPGPRRQLKNSNSQHPVRPTRISVNVYRGSLATSRR